MRACPASRALTALEQMDHLLPDSVQVGAKPDEHLTGYSLALADQAEQDVLGADVIVAELERLTQRQLQHLLGPGSERDVPRRRLLAPANNLPDLLAHRLQVEAQRLQRVGGNALALMEESEQDVLGADVVVVQQPGLFLSQDHDPPRPVGKPLEHLTPPPLQSAPVRAVRKPEGSRSPFRVAVPFGRLTARCGTGPPSWKPCDQRIGSPRNRSSSPSLEAVRIGDVPKG